MLGSPVVSDASGWRCVSDLQIRKLRLRLLPLLALEDKGRSVSLTLADLKTLEDKSELEAAIAALEAASRGWYLSDEDFAAMCRLEQEEAAKKHRDLVRAQAAKGAKAGGGPKPAAGSGWVNVGAASKAVTGPGSRAAASRGSSFAAAFDNDDSD